MGAPVCASAATQTLFDTTYLIPPSATAGTSGSASYTSSPLVIASRGTLTASITPGVFGAAMQNLSFNLISSSAALPLRYSGSGPWTGSLDVDPGTYFALASGTTRVSSSSAITPLGFLGVRIEFTPSTATVVPLPGAAGLLAGFLGVGALFGRRRRLARSESEAAIRT
jgi:hypothetical protein